MNKLLPIITASLCLGLAACESDGPAEELGESIDNAASDLRDSGDSFANNVEDACEDIKDGMGAKDEDC